MPLYEYRCSQCEKVTEALQKFSDPPLDKCECGGPLQKLVSRTSFQLKGSGWYATDYKKSSAPASTSAGESAPAKTPEAPKSSGTSET